MRDHTSPFSTHGALDLSTYLVYRMATAMFEGAVGVLVLIVARGDLKAGAIFGVAGFTALTSVLLYRVRHRLDGDLKIAVLFACDLITLSIFLGLTGGPSNPFSVLYLVQVTLASMVLRGRLVWAMTCSASLLYGVLFWWHDPLPAVLGGHDMGMSAGEPSPHAHHAMSDTTSHDVEMDTAFSAHLQGMWLAFSVTAALLTALVTRVSSALASAQEERLKTSRLLGLTTLAAGAAHELGGPLATIKVAAGELRHLVGHEGSVTELIAETRVIDEELDRVRDILDRMALNAGQLKGEGLSNMTLGEFAASLVTSLRHEHVQMQLAPECASTRVTWPHDAMCTAINQLVKNAHEAHATTIAMHIQCDLRHILIGIDDDGEGFSEVALERSGEPFFTTKHTGSGMGLGVFLAMSLCEQLGGTLTLANRTDVASGGRVTMRMPRPPITGDVLHV